MKYFVMLASVLVLSFWSDPASGQAQANQQAQAKRFKDEMTAVNMAYLTDNKCALLTPLGRIAAKAKAQELRQIAARAGFSDVGKFEASIVEFVEGQTCAGLGKSGFVKAGKERVERLVALQVASWQYYFKYFRIDHNGNEFCNYHWTYKDLLGTAQINKSLADAVSGLPEARKKQMAQHVKDICESEQAVLAARPVMRDITDVLINSTLRQVNEVKFGKMLHAYRGEGASIERALIEIPWAVEGTTWADMLGNGSPITDGSVLGQSNSNKTVRFGFARNKQFFMIIDSGLSNTNLGADILDARIGTEVPDHSWVLRASTKEFNAADVPERFGDVVYAMNMDQSAALMKAILAGEQLNLAYTRKLFETETIKVQDLDGENLKNAVLYAFAPKISF